MSAIPPHVEGLLANFDPATQFIAVDKSDKEKPTLVVLNRKDFSCWQFFLKLLFGCGKLRKFDITLVKVTSYMSQFDFTLIKQAASEETADRSSNTYKAYLTACGLANRALFYKGKKELFDKTSVITKGQIKVRDFTSHRFNQETEQDTKETINLSWNPLITFEVLKCVIPRINNNSIYESLLSHHVKYPHFSTMANPGITGLKGEWGQS